MIIGYCYVVCDILHDGHIEYFRESKLHCDKLICGVLTDRAIIIKPRPIMPFDRRVKIVQAIKYFDEVVTQFQQSPLSNCMLYKPDILFESETHIDFHLSAIKYMKGEGKKVIFTGKDEGRSSTKIKEQIRDTYNSERAH